MNQLNIKLRLKMMRNMTDTLHQTDANQMYDDDINKPKAVSTTDEEMMMDHQE